MNGQWFSSVECHFSQFASWMRWGHSECRQCDWLTGEEMWETGWRNVERVEAWEWPWPVMCGDMSWPPEGQRRGPGNSVSSESDVKPLSALPGWWCLPPGIYRCQHPRETILNNLSSSLQSGEMSPVHLEIADWQLPFLGLSRSNPSHSYNYLNSKQGLSLLTHIFIISTLTRLL